MDLSKFKQDTRKTENGVTVDLGDGLKVVVARVGNASYQKKLEVLTKPYKRQMHTGTLDKEVAEKIMTEVYASTILLGWEGLTENNEPLAYSKENAMRVLADPQYVDFRKIIEGLADELEVFRVQDIEDTVKN